MNARPFDYTTMRVGSRTAYGLKIVRCPTCGRRGEYKPESLQQLDGNPFPATVAHAGEMLDGGPFPMRHVSDSCILPLSPEGEAQRAAYKAKRAAYEARKAARLAERTKGKPHA